MVFWNDPFLPEVIFTTSHLPSGGRGYNAFCFGSRESVRSCRVLCTRSAGFMDEDSKISGAKLRPCPSRCEWLVACLGAASLTFITRWPLRRLGPMESDEFGFLQIVERYFFPPHHTLFLAMGRTIGRIVGDPYDGFILLDIATSAAALVMLWWWLRAVVAPDRAAWVILLPAFGPIFWSYGCLAGNYTAIVAVGSLLLGVAWRGPNCRNLAIATVVLAFGTGYRQDIGTLWLPVYLFILWQNRWRPALVAGLAFTVLNLMWLGAMLASVGGFAKYKSLTAEFAYSAGYLNSYFNLGFLDGPLRYTLKIVMALVGTLGLGLLYVPSGLRKVLHTQPRFAALLLLSVLPALGFHLIIHFGLAGYAMHYVPALLALIAIGIAPEDAPPRTSRLRIMSLAMVSACFFLFYPTDYSADNKLADFNMSFARCTRIGLNLPIPKEGPKTWRTINSAVRPDN